MPPRIAAAAAAIALLSTPALAATAHNSQAGFYGPNTHTCEATPYFAEGGCLSGSVVDDTPFVVPPRQPPPGAVFYRSYPPLRGLDR